LRLAAGRFDLAPLGAADAGDLLAEFSDPRVVEWMDIDPLRDLDEALAIVGWAADMRALGAGLRWAIRERAGGVFVGTCGFNAIVVERGRRGEIAYDLHRAWQGRGVMAEILPVAMAFGFGRLALHRLEAMVTPGNDRSCRLLERHGFRREGLLAGHAFWKGRYWDQIVYGLTRRPEAPTL
jgi:ribosomal-protein-alanine N-acetyltransferase